MMMNKKKIHQYDCLRVTAIHCRFSKAECCPGVRTPEVGDTAAVVEMYHGAEVGYELEPVGERGQTNWRVTVAACDIDFEKINPRRAKQGPIRRNLL
jgi:hypothetical protein